MDDGLSAHERDSDAANQSVNDAYFGMLNTRHNNPAERRLIILGQRIREDDLPGTLIRRGYPSLSLPLVAKEDESHQHDGRTVYKRAAGEVLQPSRYPLEVLESLKNEYPPLVFAAQYQQSPHEFGAGLFKRDNFPLVPAPGGGRIVCSWDIASSTRATASYTVGQIFRMHPNVCYLVGKVRFQEEYAEIEQRAIEVHRRFAVETHLVEKTSLGPALAHALRSAGAKVDEIPVTESKRARIERHVHSIHTHVVQLSAGLPNPEEFIDELVAYPDGSKDDQVDALSQMLDYWKRAHATEPGKEGMAFLVHDPRRRRGAYRLGNTIHFPGGKFKI